MGSGEARHFWPLPQNPPQVSENFLFKFLHDGAVHPPKPRKPTSQLAVHFRLFGFFPGPQTKKAQQGLGTASCEWVFWGFRVTGKVKAKDLAPVPGSNPAGERA